MFKYMCMFFLSGIFSMPILVNADSIHFVSCTIADQNGKLCVAGKEAGLGNQGQITVEFSVVAHCQNRGGNKPQAQNKVSFETSAVEQVQNGHADYLICLTPVFEPSCSPPMSVVVDSRDVFDASNDVACTLQ